MPKASKAKIAANNRNTKKHYDRLPVFTTKERGAEIRAAALAAGKSINKYVMDAIDEYEGKQSK